MDTMWTPHRFSGGPLALVVANTVVLRVDPTKTFDRFAEAEEVVRFAAAAEVFCAEETGGVRLTVDEPAKAKPPLVAMREAIDALFRAGAVGGGLPAALLAPLLDHAAVALRGTSATLADAALVEAKAAAMTLESAVALSALRLLERDNLRRVRICGHCGWLFLDRSRNGSRVWCDMTVCGNRRKARRHYQRRTTEAAHG